MMTVVLVVAAVVGMLASVIATIIAWSVWRDAPVGLVAIELTPRDKVQGELRSFMTQMDPLIREPRKGGPYHEYVVRTEAGAVALLRSEEPFSAEVVRYASYMGNGAVLIQDLQGRPYPALGLMRGRRHGRATFAGKTQVPFWTLTLMPAHDAERYAREWEAHLTQLVREGALRRARADRRQLAFLGIGLAISLRLRRSE